MLRSMCPSWLGHGNSDHRIRWPTHVQWISAIRRMRSCCTSWHVLRGMAPAPLGDIHDDILISIFSYLSVPDLARCAAVCTQWNKIVMDFTHLWKGKKYVTNKSPTESEETRAILKVLPPLQEIVIQRHHSFDMEVLYPRLLLFVTDISDLGAVQDCQRLKCTYLSTKLHIAEDILSSHSPFDLVALRKLRIDTDLSALWSETNVECAIGSALELCPNLRQLSIGTRSLWADYLDTREGIGRLQMLEIECRYLEHLSFLRHCSDTLEVLELKGCFDTPPAAYTALRHLGNLKRLRLRDCCIEGEDLEDAVIGMRSLVSLQLVDCELVSDLYFLRHCGQLRELLFEAAGTPVTGLRHLPAGVRSLCLDGDVVTAEELSEALPCLPLLEELDLRRSELAHLGFLRRCPQLRRLCLEVSTWSDASELSNVRHLVRLELLDLTGCVVDGDALSRAVPSLPRLGTLLLGCAPCVTHLRFLRHCPQLHTLSLFAAFVSEVEAYRELCHLTNLKHLYVDRKVIDYVCDLVRPCLPHLKVRDWADSLNAPWVLSQEFSKSI